MYESSANFVDAPKVYNNPGLVSEILFSLDRAYMQVHIQYTVLYNSVSVLINDTDIIVNSFPSTGNIQPICNINI